MVWAAVIETGNSPMRFLPFGVKLNPQRYIVDILEGCLLPWAKKLLQGVPRSFQQNLTCALSRFQDHPVLDSEENPLIHKQGS